MSGQIFISYRRDDSPGSTGRLFDHLTQHFGPGKIFMDVDAIEPGVDFVKTIEGAVAACDVLIAVIGGRWLLSSDESRRLLDNPEDFVRLEIAAALKRDIRVIPVLVDGASMPSSHELPDDLKPLIRRNALELSHARFSIDSGLLVRAIERVLQQVKLQEAGIAPTSTERAETEHILSKNSEAEQQKRLRVEEKQPSAEKEESPVRHKQMSGPESKRHLWFRPLFVVALVLLSAVLVAVISNRDKLLFFLKPDLSGTWSCNDGATYTIQQDGRKISWIGDNPPAFRNSFEGRIIDESYVEGTWHDFPGYSAFSSGNLTLKIESPVLLARVSQTGGFSGSIWNKIKQ